MQLVPEPVRLSDYGKPPAGLIPAQQLRWRELNGDEACFEVEFGDGSLDTLRVVAFQDGTWRLHMGQQERHDLVLPHARVPLSVRVSQSAVCLEAGAGYLEVDLDVPGLLFSAQNQRFWQTVGLDINVGDAPQSFPLFRHAQGMGMSFELQAGERVYGGGEDFGPLLKNGRSLDFHNADALGVNGALRYQSTPFIWASRSGGLALLNAAPSRLDVGARRHEILTWTTSRPGMTLWIQPGTDAPAALSAHRRALPRPVRAAPDWSLALWLSRCYYRDQAEVEKVVREAKLHDVAFGVINLDARCWMRADTRTDFVWDTDRFDPYPQFLAWLRAQGLQVCLWENPYVSSKTEWLYTDGMERGFFAKHADGRPYPLEWVPEGLAGFPKAPPSGLVDFTNPQAWSWWKDQHRPFIRAGVRCFKTDFGEEIPVDAQFHDGSDGWLLRNVYADLYNACVSEVLQEEVGDEGMVWARSGWFTPACAPVKWAGDSQTSWRALRATLRGGLSQAVGGALFWSHDIGGFYGPAPDPELYLRWTQIGLWGSHARCHGTTAREPWSFGAPVLHRFRQALALRIHLLPYFCASVRRAVAQRRSFMQPMWLACPREMPCVSLDDQWLAGDDVLVAPFLEPTGGRTAYLPPGLWLDLRTGESLTGGIYVETERTPHLPAWGRANSPFAALFRAAPALLEG